MDKNTLSNYGWIVIAVLVLSVMIALATPFGSYIEQGVRVTTEGLFDTSKNAVNSAFADLGVQMDDQTFEEGYTGVKNEPQAVAGDGKLEYGKNDPDLNHKGIIPEGAIYETTVITGYMCEPCSTEFDADEKCPNCGGDWTVELPQTISYQNDDQFPTVGSSEFGYADLYKYGDYEYFYDNVAGGWNVLLSTDCDKNIASGTILESINGKPIISMDCTFGEMRGGYIIDISQLVIPSTVTSMYETFSMTQVKDASMLVIPKGVTDISGIFLGSSIEKVPAFPASITKAQSAFDYCTKLSEIVIDATDFDFSYMLSGSSITSVKMSNGQTHPKEAEILATK